MANKNKEKVIQMLSPENYIRKKARSLPIHECWITENWEDSGMANIVIARSHTNGNITFCIYLVDLYCLGVKDSIYNFNTPKTEYRSFIEKFSSGMAIELVEYALVHNIIFAAVEFAEDFGFKPCKDFTSLTEFMLEEDNEDIELIEIECGKNGKPLYVQGPDDDTAKVNKIMKQLEHSAGVGNFDFIQEVDPKFGDGWGDDDEDDWDEFEDITLEEKGNKFMAYYDRIKKLTDDEYADFLDLLQSIVDDLMDIDAYNRFCDELFEELNQLEINRDEIPNELFGVDKNARISDEIKQAFLTFLNESEPLKQRKKQIDVLRKNKGFEAAVDYLDIVTAGFERSRKYESKLKEAALKYPDYSILQLKWTKNRITSDINLEDLPHYPCKLENFFPGRDSLHPWEYFCYLDTFTHFVIAEHNFAKLDALKTVLDELDLDENEIQSLILIINLIQMSLVANHFKE